MQPEEIGQVPAEDASVAREPEAAPTTDEAELLVAQPAPERKPFWGYLDLALVIGLLFASTVVIGVAAGVLLYAFPKLQVDQTPLLVPANLTIYAALYFSLKLPFKLRYGRPVFTSLGWKKPGVNLGLMALGGVLLALCISALAAVVHTPKIPTPFDKLTGSTGQMILFAVMAVAIAPLFEELFFRGFIQPLLVRSVGPIAGIAITAILFGSLHLAEYSWAWQYALFISLAGAIFGWLRYRTDSIVPSTVMHGCFNAVSVIALFFGKNI